MSDNQVSESLVYVMIDKMAKLAFLACAKTVEEAEEIETYFNKVYNKSFEGLNQDDHRLSCAAMFVAGIMYNQGIGK